MYTQRNKQARSSNHRRRRKAISITYSEYVYVALVIQHTMRLHRRLYSIFPYNLIKGTILLQIY